MTTIPNRERSLDIARAISVLYIVAFWHVEYYMPKGTFIKTEKNEVLATITISVLGVFTFISGYFLKKYDLTKSSQIKQFYINRLKRFYILYLISLVTLYLTGNNKWITSKSVLIKSMAGGISILFPPPPSTLWYFCMLMIFYLITPILLHYQNPIKRTVISVATVILFGILSKTTGMSNLFHLYLLIYIIGLNFDEKNYNKLIKHKYKIAIISVFSFLIFTQAYNISHAIFKIINSLIFMLVLLSISQIFANIRSSKILNFFEYIGYASMCAYLFHRQIYDITEIIFHKSNITLTPLVMYILVIPSVFITSTYIQKIYDYILKRIQLRESSKYTNQTR
jgi:peptidoglycan/LPS O-acetylase OafA/YrhL